ncbi:MAG: hypothetical protein AAF572_13645 [Cyanobacteria bacterium P01_B01_bin.77]
MDATILLTEDAPTDAAILSAAFDDIGCLYGQFRLSRRQMKPWSCYSKSIIVPMPILN